MYNYRPERITHLLLAADQQQIQLRDNEIHLVGERERERERGGDH